MPNNFLRALPFASSFLCVPLLWIGATHGGLWLWLVIFYGWYMIPVVDLFAGKDDTNPDDDSDLFWFRAITLIWCPVQLLMIYGVLWYLGGSEHLDFGEKVLLVVGLGAMTGAIGMNFAHELMHQPKRLDRWMADILLASVLYSHFRSEHLIVHHTHVGTPRDYVTARYNEGFWVHLTRVVPGCFRSALRAEGERLEKRGLSPWDWSNPFWLYFVLQYSALFLAGVVGGLPALGWFILQAAVAVVQLELINYIEHYGLVRQKRDDGGYEPVRPRHSWNATARASNWFLLNLQRHSDHHYKPSRPFPLLQTFGEDEAPMLPLGYHWMTLAAVVPPVFRRIMNPRVRAWRKLHYPDVNSWPRLPEPNP